MYVCMYACLTDFFLICNYVCHSLVKTCLNFSSIYLDPSEHWKPHFFHWSIRVHHFLHFKMTKTVGIQVS